MNKTIADLTLDEKIGQLVMVGFDALDVNEHVIELIQEYRIGNIILFARNVQTPEQLFTLNKHLQQLAMMELGIPLFISIDQEGGMVTRIKKGSTFFPGAMTIAATNDANNAYYVGKYMGQELKLLGINMNLAPTLDVNNNPYNPVIGVRSYSDDPKMVSLYGNKFIKGMQEFVIATAKHFPGHGDTKVDSHLALPTIEVDQERFESVELLPFKDAIKQGVKAIMSSHIYFPLINEEERPTTLSKNSLTGLLRNTLQFEGLIVTDCMEMKAIQHKYTTPIGAKMAIEAGANIVCISHTKDLQIASIQAIKEAVLAGEIGLDIIDERVNRVLRYKQDLEQVKEYVSFEDVKHVVICEPTKIYAERVVEQAITLVKGVGIQDTKNTLLIASSPLATTIADEDDGENDIISAVQKDFPEMKTLRVSIRPTMEEIKTVVQHAQSYDQVIYCSYNANINTTQIDMMNALQQESKKLFVFTMRNPYDTFFSSTIENVICFYEYTPNSIQALLKYLHGCRHLQGRSPVHYE